MKINLTALPYVGNGGPAFPYHDPGYGRFAPETQCGMSVRDFFAAHAPAEIPEWFQAETSEPRPRALSALEALTQQTGWTMLDQPDTTLLVDWLKDGTYDLPEGRDDLAKIGEPAAALFTASRAAVKAWEDAYTVQRYFAWRWYYAHLMVATRAQLA